MLEIILLMLATGVQSAAAIDGGPGGDYASETPTEVEREALDDEVDRLTEDMAETAEAEPEPAREPETVAVAPAPEPAPTEAPEQTAAITLPSFPPKPTDAPQPAPTVALQPAPAPAPEAEPVAAAPEPAPQPTVETVIPPAFLAPKGPEPTPGLVAEPQVASGRFLTALEVKPILNATKGNWIAVREYGGQDLLYVTHLWSWRCGLLEIRIGLNGAPPEIWPMPECHTDLPAAAAILETDGLPYGTFPLRSVQLIEVMLTYDDLTTTSVRFNRAGVVIP